jgi:hypothetical protein
VAQKKQDQEEDPYIDPKGKHPAAAVYVARDKKSGAEVSFDQWGRRLDGIGNVVAESRQRAGDAGAKAIRPKAEPKQPEQPKGPPPQSSNGYVIGAGITPAPTQRSSWDNSVLPGTSAPAVPSTRSVPPGVLAPGGVDPATGQKFPTAFNGMLPSTPQTAPQAPQMGPQEETPWRTGWGAQNEVRMPWESFAGEYVSPITREPMEAIPGFGMVPTSNIPMDIGGLSMPQIYDPQGPRRDMPVEDIDPRYVPQGGIYDPQGRRRR